MYMACQTGTGVFEFFLFWKDLLKEPTQWHNHSNPYYISMPMWDTPGSISMPVCTTAVRCLDMHYAVVGMAFKWQVA